MQDTKDIVNAKLQIALSGYITEHQSRINHASPLLGPKVSPQSSPLTVHSVNNPQGTPYVVQYVVQLRSLRRGKDMTELTETITKELLDVVDESDRIKVVLADVLTPRGYCTLAYQ